VCRSKNAKLCYIIALKRGVRSHLKGGMLIFFFVKGGNQKGSKFRKRGLRGGQDYVIECVNVYFASISIQLIDGRVCLN